MKKWLLTAFSSIFVATALIASAGAAPANVEAIHSASAIPAFSVVVAPAATGALKAVWISQNSKTYAATHIMHATQQVLFRGKKYYGFFTIMECLKAGTSATLIITIKGSAQKLPLKGSFAKGKAYAILLYFKSALPTSFYGKASMAVVFDGSKKAWPFTITK